MKLVVGSIGLSLALLHWTISIPQQPLQAQVRVSSFNVMTTMPVAQRNILPAEVVKPSKVKVALDQGNLTQAVQNIEEMWDQQYEDYFRRSFPDPLVTDQEIAVTLNRIASQTGTKAALIYVVPMQKHLELVLITPGNRPIHKRVSEANRKALLQHAEELTFAITRPRSNYYLPIAQQLYQWMIAPLQTELKAENIDTLIFCMGAGLRTIPLAALHDGQKFLVENYSLARIPAFTLIDPLYKSLKNSPVLAMGASEFEDQDPLPSVPVEISTIADKLWQGNSFLNQDFTVANLQKQRQKQPFRIIHLATHAHFEPGDPSNSYVQFWNTKLTLDKMNQLGWKNPPVQLLVLSACRTAIGDKDAELGFAGLAVQTGVSTAVASLWNVSDEGTLGLMTEFYRYLQTEPTKAEALRQAQLAMLKGQVLLKEGQLYNLKGNISLPPTLAALENQDFSHPYYWAAFTVIGSPW